MLTLIPRLVSGDRPISKKDNSTALLNVSGSAAMDFSVKAVIGFLLGTTIPTHAAIGGDNETPNKINPNIETVKVETVDQVNHMLDKSDEFAALKTLNDNLVSNSDWWDNMDGDDTTLQFLEGQTVDPDGIEFRIDESPLRKLHAKRVTVTHLTAQAISKHKIRRQENLKGLPTNSKAYDFFFEFGNQINIHDTRDISLADTEALTNLIRLYNYFWPQAENLKLQLDSIGAYYVKIYADQLEDDLKTILDMITNNDFEGASIRVIALDERVRLEAKINQHQKPDGSFVSKPPTDSFNTEEFTEEDLEYLKSQRSIMDIMLAAGEYGNAKNLFNQINQRVTISAALTSWYTATTIDAFALTTAWVVTYNALN